jgi:hypothetical protein
MGELHPPISELINKGRQVHLVNGVGSGNCLVEALEAVAVVAHVVLFEGFERAVELDLFFEDLGGLALGVVFDELVASCGSGGHGGGAVPWELLAAAVDVFQEAAVKGGLYYSNVM